MNRSSEVRLHYLVFLGLGIGTCLLGWLLTPDFTVQKAGMWRILVHPSLLPTDYFAVGGIGVGLVNAGLLTLAVLIVYRLVGATLTGLQVAALMMVYGYAFFGKNLFNIWPLAAGVFVAAAWKKESLADAAPLAFFAGSLSPLVSVLAFGEQAAIAIPLAVSVPISVVAGFIAGVLIGRYAVFVRTLHRGMVLYNGAMSSGIVGILAYFVMRSIGLENDSLRSTEFITGQNALLGWIVVGVSVYFLITGLLLGGGRRGIRHLLIGTFRGTDFVYQYSMGRVLINMGVVSLLSLAYILLLPGAQLDGPVVAGLFTVVGFAAHGATAPGVIPPVFGVFLGAFLTGGLGGLLQGAAFLSSALAKAASRDMLVAAMFAGGFAPMMRLLGPMTATTAGAVHSIAVSNIAPLHGWMVGYNNGFSMGLVAILFLPVLEMMGRRDFLYRWYGRTLGRRLNESESVLRRPRP